MRAAIEKQQAAAALQRTAVKKQAETLGLWIPPGNAEPSMPAAADPVEADCDPLDDKTLSPLIESAAKTQELQPKLLRAVIERESAFRPCAVSLKGAKGLMQLMPDTAGDMGVINPFDPKQNIDGGAKYLKQLLVKYGGDLAQALGAYNAGPGTVDQAGGVPTIRETRDYVNAIMKKMN
jgi:soluble lytic murein transglycosylase-like protein